MKILRKLWAFYTIKLILAFILATLLSAALHLYQLSGAFLLVATVYILVYSFKDPSFKKKDLILKIIIYIFIAIFCVAGVLAIFQGKNAGNSIPLPSSSSDLF